MKIVILVASFLPKWIGGTEIATYNIAKNLANRGHEVHVITSLDKGMPKEYVEDGFYVHRILFRKIVFLGILSFWLKIFWRLKEVDPDIIHVQSIAIGIPAFLSKNILKIPYIVYGRGSDVYLHWSFKKSISKLVIRNANAVIALTEDMKTEILKSLDIEISVIPNGIDLDKFKNLSKKYFREKWELKEDEKIIAFVGTLRPVKGLKYLIQAMAIMIKKDASIKLILVGDGGERKYLKTLVEELKIENNIKFIGKVANENVPQYMVASDVFVLPSLSEGFPIVSLEAMACELPIVASKVGGLPDIVKNGVNGFLVEPKNPEQIAAKVLLLLGNNALKERISKNNKITIKGYSWERVVDRLELVYRNYL
jgi:N-acetyl-alpha-D-glucosaminyl L-malate synthase BshA